MFHLKDRRLFQYFIEHDICFTSCLYIIFMFCLVKILYLIYLGLSNTCSSILKLSHKCVRFYTSKTWKWRCCLFVKATVSMVVQSITFSSLKGWGLRSRRSRSWPSAGVWGFPANFCALQWKDWIKEEKKVVLKQGGKDSRSSSALKETGVFLNLAESKDEPTAVSWGDFDSRLPFPLVVIASLILLTAFDLLEISLFFLIY